MLTTQKDWYSDDPRIAQGTSACLSSFLEQYKKSCSNQQQSPLAGGILEGRGMRNRTFWDSEMKITFRAHFLVYWFGIYAAPETKQMSKFWNDYHPGGMWDYRWGDQQWWPRPIAMFGTGDLWREIDCFDLIDTDNEKYVVHKQWPR